MLNSEVGEIIRQLKNAEISVFDIPEDYKNDMQIVDFERKSGFRMLGKRGFDVITNSFFVEESLLRINEDGREVCRNIFSTFDNFDSYFDFLQGDIYDNACYMFCDFTKRIVTSHQIDMQKLRARKAFVDDNVDNYFLAVSDEEISSYDDAKKIHSLCKRWIQKFNACDSYDQFEKTVSNYQKSQIASIVDVTFFFFQYIFADVDSKERFNIIMEYMSSEKYPVFEMIEGLCSIYNPDDVERAYNASYKHKKNLKEYIRLLKNKKIDFGTRGYFDKKTHYYCEKELGYKKGNRLIPDATIYRYFESFDEFVDYLDGDLRYCDLSGLLECDIDFSDYIVDETTKLPIQVDSDGIYSIEKYYQNKKFYVVQRWHNISGAMLKEDTHTFDYFFDFVAFLKNDLSGADLLFCDGLIFLSQWDTIDFFNAKMKSSLCEKFGLNYEVQEVNDGVIEFFDCVEQNENETALVLQTSRDLAEEAAEKDLSSWDVFLNLKCQRIDYISDLHLIHRLKNAGCRSKEDIKYVIQKIAETIANEAGSILLIDGDVASDFGIFQLFVKILSKTLEGNTQVIFTLGNHELWSFPGLTINQITLKYRTCLEKYGMYLLQNDLLYKDGRDLSSSLDPSLQMIQYEELCSMGKKQISERLRSARYVILGGLGFSGYNTEFNADNGIYRLTVDRSEEIKQSKVFEELYHRFLPVLEKKNTIILTHTPKKDWCSETVPDKNFVYVSGHTHRNFFHDDGEYRIYSDNQIGYRCDTPHLKTFLIDNDYDYFSDYDDGIFEITREQYNDFYRGINIQMTFQRNVNVLYMLKRNGYYCFIHKSKSGSLTILNGGVMKKIGVQEIQYYYDHMDAMIATIKKPLDKFNSFQKHIANIVKRIGGDGTIHGCIIDIDVNNHIYVNPFDLSTTGYWASDMINKIVYPSIPDLLKEKCPVLFGEYVKLIDDNSENALVLKQQIKTSWSPQLYLDTNIYKASREIRKMQRLNSNVLTTWYENAIPQITKK